MTEKYIGLMSGTSLDGVDGVLVDFADGRLRLLAHCAMPFAPTLRRQLVTLMASGSDELERSARAGIELAATYAQAVSKLLRLAGCHPSDVRAVGAHGQTVRHRPQQHFSVQLNAPAHLAEACGISVVADFRSRDLAAGGQGAPLVPAFHRAVFAHPTQARAVINIGGISNVTLLDGEQTLGFDCGPGNTLLDGWIEKQLGFAYDQDGQWAAQGRVDDGLLRMMLAEPYFAQPAPKSTGRELFNMRWLNGILGLHPHLAAVDVQATLLEVTALSIAQSIPGPGNSTARAITSAFVCGGGARNVQLMQRIAQLLPGVPLQTTDVLGIDPQHVEAMAFAWLARACVIRQAGNVPRVTGAKAGRVLGAIYPA